MNKAIICMILFVNFIAAEEEGRELKLPYNPLNSELYPPEIKSKLLETAGIFNCAEVFHVSNLELVCTDWSRLINDRFTVSPL